MKLLVASSVFAVYFASAASCEVEDWTNDLSSNFFTTACTDLTNGGVCTLGCYTDGYETSTGSVTCNNGNYEAIVATVLQCGTESTTGIPLSPGCGCGANTMITAVSDSTTHAYCAACGDGYSKVADTTPHTSVPASTACAVIHCGTDSVNGGAVDPGCGCEADFMITDIDGDLAYCVACAGTHFKAADATPLTAVPSASTCVLHCGTDDSTAGQFLDPGCGCKTDTEIKAVGADPNKAYCKDCDPGLHKIADTTPLTVVPGSTACAANVCTCTDGTPTIAAGSDGTLCGTDGQEDCSECTAGYSMSATAGAGSQTCTVTQCGTVSATGSLLSPGCGCGANTMITAVSGSTTHAYCLTCGAGNFKVADAAPRTTVPASTLCAASVAPTTVAPTSAPTSAPTHVLQCGTSSAGVVLKTAGCGCPADHEVKVTSGGTKLYCLACGTGYSRAVDEVLVTDAAACTAVAGKCSGNKASADNLAKLTSDTYGFDCGAGFTVKTKASAFSGTDAAAQKVACCTVTQCGPYPGILKTDTCGCDTNEEVKDNTLKLYCAACSTSLVRSASTTAGNIAVPCVASSAPTAGPSVAPTSNSTSNSTTTVSAAASTTVTVPAGKVKLEVRSTVSFFEVLSATNETLVKGSYCDAVGIIDGHTPTCSIKKSSTRRRLLAELVPYDLAATFVVNKTSMSDFTEKATARQESAKEEFLKDSVVITANGGEAPTYVSNKVAIDGKEVTAAPTDDNEIDFSGSSALTVSFGVICYMLL